MDDELGSAGLLSGGADDDELAIVPPWTMRAAGAFGALTSIGVLAFGAILVVVGCDRHDPGHWPMLVAGLAHVASGIAGTYLGGSLAVRASAVSSLALAGLSAVCAGEVAGSLAWAVFHAPYWPPLSVPLVAAALMSVAGSAALANFLSIPAGIRAGFARE